jgi:membrane protein YdbS with pleckstrin-like domain
VVGWLEKTFFIATLTFNWIIAVSLAVFAFFAFKLHYPLIGACLVLIFAASCTVNVKFAKKWRETSKN